MGEIHHFQSKLDRLEGMTDADILNHFLAELHHPGAQGRLAERIIDYVIVQPQGAMSDERLAWRERMVRIRLSTGISDQDWDRLVDKNDEAYDAGFASIAMALKDTRDQDDLVDERKALQILLDLRIAAINRGLHDTKEWELLASKLRGL